MSARTMLADWQLKNEKKVKKYEKTVFPRLLTLSERPIKDVVI
jgi:hypothetical protein